MNFLFLIFSFLTCIIFQPYLGNQNTILESKVWKDLDITNVNLEMKVVIEKQFFSERKFKKTSEGVKSF